MTTKGTANPEIEKYKAMLRNSGAYDEPYRSEDFVSPSASPSKKKFGSVQHKWGKPSSPEQYRPDDFLGSPSSAKRGYKVKTSLPNSLPIADLDGDNDSTAMSVNSVPVPSKTVNALVSPGKSSSFVKTAPQRGISEGGETGVPPMFAASVSPPGSLRKSLSKVSPKVSKSMPKKFQSEGGKPGVPSMFAASMSPNGGFRRKSSITKSPKGPTLPDAQKYLNMRSSNSDVPAAFRSSLNNGINIVKSPGSDVVGRYGLSPGVLKKRSAKPLRATKSVVTYDEMKKSLRHVDDDDSSSLNNDTTRSSISSTSSDVVEKYGLSPAVVKRRSGKPVRATKSVVTYDEMKKSLKHVDDDEIPDFLKEGSPLQAARQRVATKRSSLSPKPNTQEKRRSSLSPKPTQGARRSSLSPKPPKSPKRGAEANSPMPPKSPPRNSANGGVGGPGLPGLPLDVSPGTPTKKELPQVATSYAKEQEQEKSPILKREMIDKEKFLSSFVSFEDKEGPPISSDPLESAHKKKSKKPIRKATSMFNTKTPSLYNPNTQKKSKNKVRSKSVRSVSPTRDAPRNFSVSPKAKQRNAVISAHGPDELSLDGSERSFNELADLKTIIAHLKKVKLPDISKVKKHKDRSAEQASHIIDIIRNLRRVDRGGDGKLDKGSEAITNTMDDLKKAGYMGSQMNDDELKKINDAQLRLTKVHRRMDDREYNYGQMKTVIGKLKKATSGHVDFLPVLEDVIAKLRKMVPNLYGDDKEETEAVIADLEKVQAGIGEREAGELASVIRQFDKNGKAVGGEGGDEEELARVIANLKSLCDIPAENRKGLFLGANLSAEEADWLNDAIERLKKAKMTDREAEECAGVIRNLKKVGHGSESDNAITRVRLFMNSATKGNEIEAVLKGLRRLNMTERDLNDLADRVARLRKGDGKNIPGELADVISGLRKAKINPKAAKEVAGIVINLRKTPRNTKGLSQGDLDREMVKLRKVLPKDNNDDLFDMVWNLRNLDLDDDAMAALENAFDEDEDSAGRSYKTLEISEPPLISRTQGDNPEMVINIRDGDTGPDEKLGDESLHWDRGSSYRPKNPDDSDFEEASTSSEETDRKKAGGESTTAAETEDSLKWGRHRRKVSSDDDSDYEEASVSSEEDGLKPEGSKVKTVTNADGEEQILRWDRHRREWVPEEESDYEEASISSVEEEPTKSVDKKGKFIGKRVAARRKKEKQNKIGGADGEGGGSDASLSFEGAFDLGLEPAGLSAREEKNRKFHYSCPLIYEPDILGNEALQEQEDKHKKIVFNEKPKWIHKKHNNTVVGEKRWRFHEGFGADEVIFSPLSKDQYNRRKKISASIFANLDSLPVAANDKAEDDDLEVSYKNEKVEEFRERKERTGRRTATLPVEDSP